MDSPIFILGIGRTGSQMLRNMLNNHDNTYIDREINFLFRFKECIVSKIKKIGDLKNDNNAKKVIEYLYSGKVKKDFSIMEPIPKEYFEEKFLKSDRSLKSLFILIISLKGEILKKKNIGAKFPVHFSYLPLLLKWFPNCKIIFLTRDPRAILSSEIEMKKRVTYSSQFPIKEHNIFFRLSVLLYVTIQWIWAQKIYNKYSQNNVIYLSKYENLVTNPSINIKKICNYLNIEYQDSMLNIQLQDSSYNKSKVAGIKKSSLDKWKTNLNWFEKKFISFFTKNERYKIGY